eukprot:7111652-Prymnesium_polylepis.1
MLGAHRFAVCVVGLSRTLEQSWDSLLTSVVGPHSDEVFLHVTVSTEDEARARPAAALRVSARTEDDLGAHLSMSSIRAGMSKPLCSLLSRVIRPSHSAVASRAWA